MKSFARTVGRSYNEEYNFSLLFIIERANPLEGLYLPHLLRSPADLSTSMFPGNLDPGTRWYGGGGGAARAGGYARGEGRD
jgi:hypothetical protein